MALLLNLLILVTVSSGEVPDEIMNNEQHVSLEEGHDPHFDHIAFLGDQKEAELFDKLPPEEAKDRLGIIAKKIDKNNDGFIDEKELGNWLSRSMTMLSQSDAEMMFKKEDANQNGFVEYDEHSAVVSRNIGRNLDPKDSAAFQSILEMLSEDKMIFDAADVEKDGKLAINEYLSFKNPYNNLDRMAMEVLYVTRRIKDINNDGKIDFDEFMKDRSTNQDEEWFKEEEKLFQSTLDKNGDGTLDKQEIIDMFRTEFEDSVKEQTSHLISKADDNRDGKLSMEEIFGHHDVFVGSQVTNSGEHPHKVEKFEDEL